MWFVKDLTEFANEARNLITGEGGQEERENRSEHPASQQSHATHQQTRRKSREEENIDDIGEEKTNLVLVGYDGNGTPLFESADTDIGSQYAAAQKSVDRQVAAEEEEADQEEIEEDDDDDDGDVNQLIRQQQEQIKQLRDLVRTKGSNEQRLQSIVSAQQHKIRALEDHIATLMKPNSSAAMDVGKGMGDDVANEVELPDPQHLRKPDASHYQQTKNSPRPPPALTNTSSTPSTQETAATTPSQPKASGSSGYESWEDVGNTSSKPPPLPSDGKNEKDASVRRTTSEGEKEKSLVEPSEHRDHNNTTPSSKNNADDEDWANFV